MKLKDIVTQIPLKLTIYPGSSQNNPDYDYEIPKPAMAILRNNKSFKTPHIH